MVNDRFNLCKRSLTFMLCSLRESRYTRDERDLSSKIHLIVNEYCTLINFIVTDGSCSDCKEVIHLAKNINAKLVFADRAYDINEILSYLNQ